jgi:hypothetical protein
VSLGVRGAADEAGGGGTAVGGDADGTRWVGPSLTRSVCDSVQAVASVATSAMEPYTGGVRRMQALAQRDGGPQA